MSAGEVHQEVEFRTTVPEKIARAGVALVEVLPKKFDLTLSERLFAADDPPILADDVPRALVFALGQSRLVGFEANMVNRAQERLAQGAGGGLAELAQRIVRAVRQCVLHSGIGADGILLFEKSTKADFKMRIVNSDGSEAEACGNGFRCIARYAKEVHGFPNKFQFESGSGLIQAEVKGERVKVQLIEPKEYQAEGQVALEGRHLRYAFINTGVPHAVIFAEGLSQIDVANLGRTIRYHKRFAPRGTNVNFVEVKGKQEIQVRTYERGVEAETLACGTGSTASAVISSLKGYVSAPVKVKTRGGEVLTVDFVKNGKGVSQVTLEGEARFVFEGKINL
jgi:diaminopimelate epimerase